MNTAVTLSLACAIATLCLFSVNVHGLPAAPDTSDTVEAQAGAQTAKSVLDGRARRSIPESTPYLLVSTWYNGIFRMNLDGSDVVQVVNGNDAGQYVRGLAVDYNGGYMYFSSFNSGFIKRSKLDGSDITTIGSCYNCYKGMAFDWMNNKLYLTNRQYIQVYDPITGVTTTVHTGWSVFDIALDPPNGMMYWVDEWEDSVYRGPTDGSQSFTIQGSELSWPQGITLDPSSQRVYWTDTYLDKVESSFVDGSDRTTHISSIDIQDAYFFKDTLYYAKWNPHEVRALDLKSGATTLLASFENLPLEIIVVYPPRGDLTILGAAYGPLDVTDIVKSKVSSNALSIQASNSIFGDSWPGITKSLVVVYQHEGYEPITAVASEWGTLNIPSRPVVSNPPSSNCPSYPLRIVGAAYGLAEVTSKVRYYVSGHHLSVVAENSVFGDTWYGIGKTLVVVYQEGNGPYKTGFVTEGNTLLI